MTQRALLGFFVVRSWSKRGSMVGFRSDKMDRIRGLTWACSARCVETSGFRWNILHPLVGSGRGLELSLYLPGCSLTRYFIPDSFLHCSHGAHAPCEIRRVSSPSHVRRLWLCFPPNGIGNDNTACTLNQFHLFNPCAVKVKGAQRDPLSSLVLLIF